jgi:hypothetical protein
MMKKFLSVLIFIIPSIVFGQTGVDKMEKYFNQLVEQ